MNKYKIETRQRLVTTAEIIDRTTGQVVATGQTVLSPEDADYRSFPGNDVKTASDTALGRAFKRLSKSIPQPVPEPALVSGLTVPQSAFLEGVRVGQSQHPQISAALKWPSLGPPPTIDCPAGTRVRWVGHGEQPAYTTTARTGVVVGPAGDGRLWVVYGGSVRGYMTSDPLDLRFV